MLSLVHHPSWPHLKGVLESRTSSERSQCASCPCKFEDVSWIGETFFRPGLSFLYECGSLYNLDVSALLAFGKTQVPVITPSYFLGLGLLDKIFGVLYFYLLNLSSVSRSSAQGCPTSLLLPSMICPFTQKVVIFRLVREGNILIQLPHSCHFVYLEILLSLCYASILLSYPLGVVGFSSSTKFTISGFSSPF